MQEKINVQINRKNHRDGRKRLPLDLPIPHKKYRTSRYRPVNKSKYEEENDKSTILLRNMVICAAIVLLVVILKSIDTPVTQNILGYVRDAVTTDFDIDETLGKLKFVDNLIPDEVKAVFSEQTTPQGSLDETAEDLIYSEIKFSVPAEGKVIAFFGEKTGEEGQNLNTGIDIQGDQNDNLYAVADGYVTAIGEDETRRKYIEIDQGNNITTLYTGCSEVSVDVGYQVKKGQQIGKMGRTESGKPVIHFETWISGKPVDPLSLIDSGK